MLKYFKNFGLIERINAIIVSIFFSLLHLQIAARLQKEKKRGGGITRGEIVPVLPSQAKFLRL